MKMVSTYYLSDMDVIKCIQTVKKYRVKIPIRADIWDWNRE